MWFSCFDPKFRLRPAVGACAWLAMLLAFATASETRAQATWSVARTGLGASTGGVNAVAYGNGRFVGVVAGVGPTLAWSTDGTSWQPSSTNVGPARDVVFASGAFFAITATTVWRSTDGAVWTRHRDAPAGLGNFTRVATDGDGLMILSGRQLFYSPDTASWQVTAPLPGAEAGSNLFPLDIVFGAGRYVVTYLAPQSGGTLTGIGVSTTDGGATWHVGSLYGNANIAGGGGRIVAIGATQIWVTTNGTIFASTPIPAVIEQQRSSAVMFGGGRFFTKRGLISSSDGMTWAPIATLNAPDANFTGIAYGNGRYVAVGSSSPVNGSSTDLVAVLPAEGPPIFSRSPVTTVVVEGQVLQLSATLENPSTATTFQWYRDNVAIAGATSATLTISTARPSDAGRYQLQARNAIGTSISSSAAVTVLPIAQAGRILNLSVLTSIDAATGPEAGFIVGFVIGGAGTRGGKPLLVRAGGPSLSRFGVAAPNPDPRIELFFGANKVADNDNWGGGPLLAATATAVGAFPFASGDSRDAAIFHTGVTPGDNSVRVSGTNGATGAVLAEIYDATPTESITLETPRLINVSVLRNLTANGTLSAGFVIGGQTAKTVLIRAIGPGLAPLGVTNTSADPRLSLFRNGTPAAIATNEDWGGSGALAAAFTSVGAFGLAAASRDAAVLMPLAPGEYVAQASGSGSGNILIEIYEVP